MRALATLALLALLGAACTDPALEQRRTAIRASLAQARSLAAEFDRQRRQGLAAALQAGLVPRADLGACPVPTTLPFGDPPAPVAQEKVWSMMGFGGLEVAGLGVVAPEDAARAKSPRLAKLEVSLGAIERDLADPDKLAGEAGAELSARAAKLAERGWWTYDLVVVADAELEPQAEGADRFRSGFIRGRAFVWDYQQAKVVCAAPVSAVSSAQVKDLRLRINKQDFTQDLDLKELQKDLHINACRHALSGLAAAGPPEPDPAPAPDPAP